MDTHSSPNSNEPKLRDHVYDGIQEYDQKLPNWWLFTLYITIVWFIGHWVCYYQFGIGSTDTEAVDKVVAQLKAERDKQMGGITDKQLWEMSRDPKVVEAGKATFMTPGLCVTCHGPDLTGMLAGAKLPGLPLNDQEWKHGGQPTEIMTIVRKGAPDITKGMAPWEGVLGIQKVTEVVAFILSHHKEGEPITKAPDSPGATGATPAPTPTPATSAPVPAKS